MSVAATIKPLLNKILLFYMVMWQVVGDDLLMSNMKRLDRAIQESACNTFVLKVRWISDTVLCWLQHCFQLLKMVFLSAIF